MRMSQERGARSITIGLIITLSMIAAPGMDAMAETSFTDGFEDGEFRRWTTTSGVRVETVEVLRGSFAARATSTGGPAFVSKTLATGLGETYARLSFKVLSRETAVTLVRLRRGDGGGVAQVYLTSSGVLAFRNDATRATTISAVPVTGGWHTLDVHLVRGTPGSVEVALDGDVAISTNTSISPLIKRIQVGDEVKARRYDVVFDDVGVGATPIEAVDTVPTTPSNVRLAEAPADTVDVRWDASTDDTGIAAYDVYRDNRLVGSVPGTETSFLDGPPSARTIYSYRVVATSTSGQRSERSAPLLVEMPGFVAGSDALVFAAGDIACASTTQTATSCWQRATSDIFVDHAPDAVLTLGDNQYEKGALDAFRKSFDPSWGRGKPEILPVIGNHEYNTPDASGYFTYFGEAAGDPTRGYYRTTLGAWTVLTLNGNCAIVSCAEGSEQHTWLAEQLSDAPTTCTLAAFHQPVWSSRRSVNMNIMPLIEVLYDGGVELLLVAHDHVYERFAELTPAGVVDEDFGLRQITVGTGGRSLYAFPRTDPNSVARDNTTFGVLKLTLHADSYEWDFVPAWGSGSFSDTGADVCHDVPDALAA